MEGEWRKTNNTVGFAMGHILETGLYSDVSFSIGSSKFRMNAHRSILQARSEVFAVMLHQRWANDDDEENRPIDIPEFSPVVFKLFLKYIYTDEFNITTDVNEGLELLKMSHQYQVDGLFEKCVELLTTKISIDNCVRIFQHTKLFEDCSVSHQAFSFILTNIGKILPVENENITEETWICLLKEDDLEITEIELFRRILHWAQSNLTDKNQREKSLKLFLRHIRFPLMDSKDFTDEVCPTGLLTNEEMLQIFMHFNGTNKQKITFNCQPRKMSVYTAVKEFEIQLHDIAEMCYFHEIDPSVLINFCTKENNHNSMKSTLIFWSNERVFLRGFNFYGLNKKFAHSISLHVQICITMYPYADDASRKSATVNLTEPGHFKVLLDEPLLIEKNKTYEIGVSIKLNICKTDDVFFNNYAMAASSKKLFWRGRCSKYDDALIRSSSEEVIVIAMKCIKEGYHRAIKEILFSKE